MKQTKVTGQELYNSVCFDLSRQITERYSTSFTHGIKTLHKRFRQPVFSIYGFVRLADEIVDSFHDFDKQTLLENFRTETFNAIENKISTNPVLQSFQLTANQYQIEKSLIEAFFNSMQTDVERTMHEQQSYDSYIYGSAETVGLMCLRVFCEGDDALFNKLKEPAKKLGSAFQKVNFLRDMKSDFEERGRIYFPNVNFNNFNRELKNEIEKEIEDDFAQGFSGIQQLPKDARFGVYVAYRYYRKLLIKIKRADAGTILKSRIRVPGNEKFALFCKSYLRFRLNIL